MAAVAGGGPVAAERRILSRQDAAEEALFMGLRMARGLDLELVKSKYGIDVWQQYGNELERFVEAGLLIYDGRRLRLTRAGMLLANEVMTVFISADVR